MSAESAESGLPGAEPPRARDVAERVWVHVAAAVPGRSAELTAHAVLRVLDGGLRRWIGAEGYAALLARAITEALPRVPALRVVAGLVPDHEFTGSSEIFSDDEIKHAVMTLLVTMMRQLGGIIGPDMAVRMIESTAKPSPRGIAGSETNDSTS